MRIVTVRNKTRDTVLGTRIAVADNSLSRLFGLMGRRSLEPQRGLLIVPSSGVHTFGMLFPIDVLSLSKELQVMRLWPRLVPFRVTSVSLRTHCFLELPPGVIAATRTEVGDALEVS